MQGRNRRCLPNIYLKRVPACRKIIFTEHERALHGGVTIVMTSVRMRYWISSLRQQAKSVIHKCYGYKKHCALPYPTPNPGPIPLERTESFMSFQIIGSDYAGPIYYRIKSKKGSKAKILLVTCSVNRAIDSELVEKLTSKEFIKYFKRLIT